MSRIRWTEGAEEQLEQIQDLTRRQWPGLVETVTRTIHAGVEQAVTFPGAGRIGKVEGTREVVLTQYPFTIVYSIEKGTLVVLGLFHHSREWSEDDLS